MKRKPQSIQFTVPSANSKEVRRIKSLQRKLIPSKKGQEISSILIPKSKGNHIKEENKIDCNNTTASTKLKMGKTKKTKKNVFEGMETEEIMDIINSFASKIQRQWRAYSIRKRWNNVFGQKKKENFHLIHLSEEISSGSMLYDKQKYDSFSSLKQTSHPGKEKKDSSSISESQENFDTPKSSRSSPKSQLQLKLKFDIPKQIPSVKEKFPFLVQKHFLEDEESQQFRRDSFNVVDDRKLMQKRKNSTGQLPPLKVLKEKPLQIGKVFEIMIEKPEPPHKPMTNPCKMIQNEAAIAFKKGSSIDKMMSKCKKQLQMGKLKQLLSVQNRYNKSEVTYKNYLEIVGKINEEHTNKLQAIRTKEGNLRNALGQLIQVYKGNHFAQDELQSSSHLDVSLSFDKWDFNASAKKAIDHFEFPQGKQGNNSKILSIESVLRQLDQEESGTKGDQQKLKKNKSLQMIEAIAERSKEISEKGVVSFQESEHNLQADNEHIKIKAVEYQKDNVQDKAQKKQIAIERYEESLKMSASFQKIVQLDEEIKCQPEQYGSKKAIEKVQQIYSSQSLLITHAEANPLISSQESIQVKPQQNFMRELIYKQIKTTVIDYEDDGINKFRELVIQKLLMTNIKFINSIKFVFAKAGDLKKQTKTAVSVPKLPFIQTGIDAINTWLLEMSHFVLDGYFHIFRDKLKKVKQPPITQTLTMARRSLTTNPPYEAIPEFIFKDFSFSYIKDLQKDQKVDDLYFDVFSCLLYTFHRALIDALNEALMEELFTGKNWIRTPWKMPQKFKAYRKNHDEVKICLERSINVVSNWSDYGLGKLVLDNYFTPEQYRLFQEEKIKLVCRQQILSEVLNPSFVVGNVMLQLSDFIYERQLSLVIAEIVSL